MERMARNVSFSIVLTFLPLFIVYPFNNFALSLSEPTSVTVVGQGFSDKSTVGPDIDSRELLIGIEGRIGNTKNPSISSVKKNMGDKIRLLQVPFLENRNQIPDNKVVFYTKTFSGAVYITKDAKLIYSLPKSHEGDSLGGWVIQESFVGVSSCNINGEEKTSTKVSWFKGSDPSKWERDIPAYNLVSLGEIYSGIEVKLRAYGNNVEKLFFVKPGKNTQDITVKVEGNDSLRLNEAGELEILTGLGIVKMTKPIAYQYKEGKKQYVNVAYTLKGQRYGFKVPNYDKTKLLIIDPLLASTFLGGSDQDYGRQIAIDSNGNIFVAGFTYSANFPTTLGAYDTINKDHDVFISKFNSSLTNLLSSTFLGGSVPGSSGSGWVGPDAEYVHDLILDKNNNIYVVGKTGCSDFPTTPGAYDTAYNGGHYDGFISTLDNTLQNLLASTYLGASASSFFGGIDSVHSIAIDGDDNVYVAGQTDGSDFPTTSGAYDQTYNGGDEGFISKLNSDLTNLLASTYLGTSEYDNIDRIIIGNNGDIYGVGSTMSSAFPTTSGAYSTEMDGGKAGFIFNFANDLQTLLASTFIGGNRYDGAQGLVLDSSGNLYVSGKTESSNFPTTPGAYNTVHANGNDIFVLKIDGQLQNLLNSTLLGGRDTDTGGFVTIGSDGTVYVSGRTASSDFPTTPDAYDRTYPGTSCIYISKFDANLSNLMASTYIDGDSDYRSDKIMALDSSGNIYVVGNAGASFPTTPGAYDTTHNGSTNDAFVAKFDSNLSASGPIATTGLATSIASGSATLNGTVNANGNFTTVTFEYGTSISYGSTITATQSPLTGTTAQSVSAGLTGLTPGTTYHVRAYATNSAGTAYGDDVTFTTTNALTPTVTTDTATSVTIDGATLNGTVNPNGASTTYYFEYGITTSYGSTTTVTEAGSGTSAVSVNASISGLELNTTYHFRLVATNSVGTTNGSDQTFTTNALTPSASTGLATSVASNTATLNGTINPNGASTTYYFEYGITTAYGSNTISTSAGSGTSAVSVNANIAGLSESTTYHFRLVATNSIGTISGSDQTFTTSSSAGPTVTTGSATLITSESAILKGKVNPNGSNTEAYFEYGTTTSYESSTPSEDIGAGTSSVAVNVTISDLISDTTYHYRLTATNIYGTSSGADMTFYTAIVYVSSDDSCGGNIPCYSTIQAAIDAAETESVIRILQGTFDEDIIMDQTYDLILSGGWDSTFTTQSSNTVFNSLTITGTSGTVEIENIDLQ